LKWYEQSVAIVKWNGQFSEMVKLTHGVRQGGVLSPILFALVVDDMLVKLNSSGLGCKLFDFPVVALMYADDILLITASVSLMQELICLCISELKIIDFAVNPIKSTWIRIGERFNMDCVPLDVSSIQISCSKETKFLGTVIMTAFRFKVSLSRNKINFFINVNKLFSKLGCSDVAVVISLMNAHCISALLYNLEVLDLMKSDVNSLKFVVTRAYMKLFKTPTMDIIMQCMFYTGQLPVDFNILIRKHRFLIKMLKKSDPLSQALQPIIQQDTDLLIRAWKEMGGVDTPSKYEAWEIFQRQVEDLQ
jgi:hypothetical protein